MTVVPPGGGVLLVDKPAGPTSHDIVAVARRALGTRRVGHTGTLDPFATGLLVVCVGAATRLVEFLTGLPKRYRAGVRLGERTTTDDPEGAVEASSERWRELGREDVERALAAFRGPILQTPPVYSAKKVAGESAHYRVRRGETVALAPVAVQVHGLDLVGWAPPDLDLDVRCSAGTYVRVLARDLGESLGVCAHLRKLRRTAVGAFEVEGALDLDGLHDPERVARSWITPARALGHLGVVHVGADAAARLALGQALAHPEPGPDRGPVAVLCDDVLVAVGELADGRLLPRKVFAPGVGAA